MIKTPYKKIIYNIKKSKEKGCDFYLIMDDVFEGLQVMQKATHFHPPI